jgi:hypothetical protein
MEVAAVLRSLAFISGGINPDWAENIRNSIAANHELVSIGLQLSVVWSHMALQRQ